jgi:hypothetical protein
MTWSGKTVSLPICSSDQIRFCAIVSGKLSKTASVAASVG